MTIMASLQTVCGKPWVNCIRHFSCKLERASKASWPFFFIPKEGRQQVLGLQAAAGGKTESVKTRSVTVVVPRWKPRRPAEEKDLLAWNKLAKDALVEEDFHLVLSSWV